MAARGGGSVQPLKEIEAAVIGDIVPVEAIEVSEMVGPPTLQRVSCTVFLRKTSR